MNKNLVLNLKKVVFSLFAVTCCVGTMISTTSLYAATKNETVSTNTVTIGDTTLTFNGVKEAPKGSIGFLVDVTIDKASGLPKEANYISLKGSGQVKINDTVYNLSLGSSKSFERISETQAHAEIFVVTTKGSKANTEAQKDMKLDLLKGKNINFNISKITYVALLHDVNPDFNELLKNVPCVQATPIEKSDLKMLKGEIKGMTNVLPSKGLNIPMAPNSSSIVDNIGFHDGILEIRVVENFDDNKYFTEINLVNSKGKAAESAGSCGLNEIMVYRFKIKDAATLAQYEVKATTYKSLGEDKETKVVSCVF